MSDMKIHYVISPAPCAVDFGKECCKKWRQTDILHASYFVSIGGDGTALKARQSALMAYLSTGKMPKVYSVDCSNSKQHVGALTNKGIITPSQIEERIKDAEMTELFPLEAKCKLLNKEEKEPLKIFYGFNEIVVRITSFQMTYMEVTFNNNEKEEIEGDGIMLATYMGQKGYYRNLEGVPFSKNQFGFRTIACRNNFNRIISDKDSLAVNVLSNHRETSVMRDCNLISPPIKSVVIRKSKLPLIVLKDRQKVR